MRIAFYAPMKPPDDPVVSGDRETARLILAALAAEGHEVEIVSRLRTWQREPDPAVFAGIRDRAAAELPAAAARCAASGAALWLTYHLYHKAPDWLGSRVAARLGLPYVVIEACRTARLAGGPWDPGFAEADRALAAADAVVALHAEDAEGLADVVGPERLHRLAPFIDAARFDSAARRQRAGDPPVIVAVAMMRSGDKEASYRLLAAALARLSDRPWRLLVAGDGPRRDDILALFPADRLDWAGAVAPDDIAAVYEAGDILAWPAVNEAFGMVLLEAQAAGLPVVAGASGGVPDIVEDGTTGILVPEGDVDAFAAALARLLDDLAMRRDCGWAAAAHIRARHDIATARRSLAAIIAAAVDRRALRAVEFGPPA